MTEERKADQIWNKVKDLTLDIFALPGQTVSMHCKRVDLSPDVVHLLLKSSAVLPALEEALRKVPLSKKERFDLSPIGRYTVLSIVSSDLV